MRNQRKEAPKSSALSSHTVVGCSAWEGEWRCGAKNCHLKFVWCIIHSRNSEGKD